MEKNACHTCQPLHIQYGVVDEMWWIHLGGPGNRVPPNRSSKHIFSNCAKTKFCEEEKWKHARTKNLTPAAQQYSQLYNIMCDDRRLSHLMLICQRATYEAPSPLSLTCTSIHEKLFPRWDENLWSEKAASIDYRKPVRAVLSAVSFLQFVSLQIPTCFELFEVFCLP